MIRFVNNKYSLNKQQRELLEEARVLLNARITYRELECGILLMFNCSVAAIAEILKISQRTAECYIHSLKLKCCCNNRWCLVMYLKQCFGVTIKCSKLNLAVLDGGGNTKCFSSLQRLIGERKLKRGSATKSTKTKSSQTTVAKHLNPKKRSKKTTVTNDGVLRSGIKH